MLNNAENKTIDNNLDLSQITAENTKQPAVETNYYLNYEFEHKLAIVFRLSALGDVVLLSGVLNFFYNTFGLRFIVVSRAIFLPLFRYHPAVFEVYPLEEKDLEHYNFKEKCRELAKRYEDYPLIDLHGNYRAKIIKKAWKNSVFSYNKLGISRRLFLWSKGLVCSKKLLSKNVCQRYAQSICTQEIPRELLKPQIYLIPTELSQAQKSIAKLFWKELSPEYWSDLSPELFKMWQEKQDSQLANYGLLRKKIIAIHPFATYEHKTLKPEKWLELAKAIKEKFAATHEILWIGKGNGFTPSTNLGKSLINKTSIRELCAILSHCDILISGDSGPMHLAHAVNCKIMGIFGPSSEEWGFFPVGDDVKIIQNKIKCRPCSLHGSSCNNNNKCLDELDFTMVLEQLSNMLLS